MHTDETTTIIKLFSLNIHNFKTIQVLSFFLATLFSKDCSLKYLNPILYLCIRQLIRVLRTWNNKACPHFFLFRFCFLSIRIYRKLCNWVEVRVNTGILHTYMLCIFYTTELKYYTLKSIKILSDSCYFPRLRIHKK